MTWWALAAAAIALGYAVVNAFGAWSVVRRRSWLGALFFSAAVALTIGAVAAAYGARSATVFVALGSAAAATASWWNARSLLRRAVPRRHLARVLVGAAATLLAYLATQ